jgi:hypothetical protein
MIIVKRTRGAIKSREASPLASWVELDACGMVNVHHPVGNPERKV